MTLHEAIAWAIGAAAAFVLGTTAAVFVAAAATWRRHASLYVRLIVAGNSLLVASVAGRVLGVPQALARPIALAGMLLEWAALVVLFHVTRDADVRVRRSTDAPAAAGAALRLELEGICELDPHTPICDALELADAAAAIATRHVEDMRAE